MRILLMISSFFLAQAVLLGPARADDFYSQLLVDFARASLPEEVDVLGMYSGRCFIHNAPGTSTSGALVSLHVRVGGDNGPLFPPTYVIKTVVVSGSQLVDHYDSGSDSVIVELSGDFSSWAPAYTAPTPVDGSLVSTYSAWDRKWDQLQIRKSSDNGYLIAKEARTGSDPYAMCYFFKKL